MSRVKSTKYPKDQNTAKYDEIDKILMKNVMMDARMSARQISLAMNVSTVTIINRLKRLEKEKIIKGYSAMIDHDKIGYNLTAIIEVSASNDKVVEVERKIAKYENVCAVYDITGKTDIIVIAKFTSRENLNNFVKELGGIPHIKNTVTHIALDVTKEDFRMI